MLASELVLNDLAVLDLHEIDVRPVLSAFLAGRAPLREVDITIDALHRDAPERRPDRLRIRLAGRLDGRDGHVDAVKAAKSFGEAADVVPALLPLVHVTL